MRGLSGGPFVFALQFPYVYMAIHDSQYRRFQTGYLQWCSLEETEDIGQGIFLKVIYSEQGASLVKRGIPSTPSSLYIHTDEWMSENLLIFFNADS